MFLLLYPVVVTPTGYTTKSQAKCYKYNIFGPSIIQKLYFLSGSGCSYMHVGSLHNGFHNNIPVYNHIRMFIAHRSSVPFEECQQHMPDCNLSFKGDKLHTYSAINAYVVIFTCVI